MSFLPFPRALNCHVFQDLQCQNPSSPNLRSSDGKPRGVIANHRWRFGRQCSFPGELAFLRGCHSSHGSCCLARSYSCDLSHPKRTHKGRPMLITRIYRNLFGSVWRFFLIDVQVTGLGLASKSALDFPSSMASFKTRATCTAAASVAHVPQTRPMVPWAMGCYTNPTYQPCGLTPVLEHKSNIQSKPGKDILWNVELMDQ